MKIKPIILCGGSGTRLNFRKTKNTPKQFIDFGNWTLLGKTLERIKSPIFDEPIISTNNKYVKQIKYHLRKYKIRKYKIILEPIKKNTAPAILCASLINDISNDQPLIIFSADHLIENKNKLLRSIDKNISKLDDQNIFIFGIKPKTPSSEYGYFVTKKIKNNIQKVLRFVEKPNKVKAQKLIKQKAYWNSGIFFLRKNSVINNFKKYQPSMYKNCLNAVKNAKFKANIYLLNKKFFMNISAKSFDYAILEKTKKINAIKLDIPWSDLGSWKEILKMYNDNKNKYFNKRNIYNRPCGNYTNLFRGKDFLIKELHIKSKGVLSLQKHYHRTEHWLVTEGIAKITIDKKYFIKKPNDYILIPNKTIHRIQNPGNKSLKIIEAQIGSLLKETDIVRYEDIYGRVKKS